MGRNGVQHKASREQLQSLTQTLNHPLLRWEGMVHTDDSVMFAASIFSGRWVTAIGGLYQPDRSAAEAMSFWVEALGLTPGKQAVLIKNRDSIAEFRAGAAK